MRNRSIDLACLIIFATLSACGGGGSGTPPQTASPPQPPPIPPSPVEPGMLGDGQLENLIGRIREHHNVPALGALVVSNGVIVEQAVDGVRSIDNNVQVSTTDQWHIGSVTKAMTANLAAILVEQSLLSWDTTPMDVWPEYASSMNVQYQDATIVQLLSHQAGLPDDFTNIPSIQATRDDATGTVVEKRHLWAKELLERRPANAIGGFLYTNAGYIIAGAMLETITGTPWETLMIDQIFNPLGMLDTGFGAPGTDGQTDQPWGHWVQNGVLVSLPPGPGADTQRSVGPAGNVHTTMSDYALFMFAHIEGELGIPGLVTSNSF